MQVVVITLWYFYQDGFNVGFNSVVVVMMILNFCVYIYFIFIFLQRQTTDIKVGYKNCLRTFF